MDKRDTKRMKRVDEHLASLSDEDKATLAATGTLCKIEGLSRAEGNRRNRLIDVKYSGDMTDAQAAELAELQGRVPTTESVSEAT